MLHAENGLFSISRRETVEQISITQKRPNLFYFFKWTEIELSENLFFGRSQYFLSIRARCIRESDK